MIKKEKIEQLKKRLSFGGVTLVGVLLFAFLIAFDLITKALAEKYFADGSCVKLCGGLVVLRLVYNRGISFGMFSDGSIGTKIAIIVVTALMMAALAVAYLFIDKRRRPLRISLIFIVAGGIGNLIDRIAFRMWQSDGVKGVRDMVDVSNIRFGSFNFGVCNFADFFITAGAILLVLSLLFFDVEAVFPTQKSKALIETLKSERAQAAQPTEQTSSVEQNVSAEPIETAVQTEQSAQESCEQTAATSPNVPSGCDETADETVGETEQ